VRDDTITVAPPEGFEPYNVLAAGTLRDQLTELLRFLNRVWTVLLTAGQGYGAHVIGNDAIAGSPNAVAEGPVRSALVALLGFVNAHLNDAAGAHAAGAIATQDQDWMTGASLHTQLGLLPQKLGAYGIGSGGARKVGQEGYSHSEGGKTTAITFGTLHDALQSLVQHIANHRGQAGADADHDGLYARKPEEGGFTASASTDYGRRRLPRHRALPPRTEARPPPLLRPPDHVRVGRRPGAARTRRVALVGLRPPTWPPPSDAALAITMPSSNAAAAATAA